MQKNVKRPATTDYENKSLKKASRRPLQKISFETTLDRGIKPSNKNM